MKGFDIIVWLLAGMLTALAAGFTAAPLAQTATRRGLIQALLLIAGILGLTFGLYLWLGQPD